MNIRKEDPVTPPIKISRQFSNTAVISVSIFVMTSLIGSFAASVWSFRDGLRENTRAIADYAKAQAAMAATLQGMQARAAEKDVRDAQQDSTIAQHEKALDEQGKRLFDLERRR